MTTLLVTGASGKFGQRSSIPGWTVLRNHWYLDNLFFSLPAIAAQGGQPLAR